MATLLFANNATSTIAAGINAAAVSVALAPGTGALYPNPGAGEYFMATFVDAATGLVTEIVKVTARATDTLTIVRAQEGTAAQSWLTGDHLSNFWTAGQAQTMVQQVQQQAQAGNYAVDTGLVNAMAITLSPVPASLASILGTPIRVKVNITNTAATPTLNINGLGAQNVTSSFGSAVGAAVGVGSLIANTIIEVVWDGTRFQYMGLVNAATTAQVQAGSTNSAPVTPFSLAGAFAASTPFTGGLNTSNYQKFPNGLIMQFGNFTCSGLNTVMTLPTTFSNRQFCSVGCGVSTGAANVAPSVSMSPATSAPVSQEVINVYSIAAGSVAINNVNFSWICFGW